MTSWTLTTSGAAISKAGANANSTIIASGSTLSKWSDDCEGYICSITRRNWVTSYTSVDGGVKSILSDITSSLVAKQIISYDMSGYTSRAEAQTMLNVQDDIIQRGIEILKDFKSNDLRTPT